eukprot:TRINITY_DN3564_c0_g1_i10.p2 TRINITY_DN3564_c0_g1~~TRINITY_DN3564_c0_g1_i10.p2  ORF type:complete len:138 (+),score=54.43 TRINITY_DN3564_c0_g1_i10:203-616(+)
MLAIWDTMGQEAYYSVTHLNYRNASAFILVYDITSRKTFNGVTRWIDDVKQNGPKDSLLVVVGNKGDLVEEEEVRTEELKDLTVKEKALSRIVSAKSDMGIRELFEELAEKLYSAKQVKKEGVELKKEEKKKRGCCF